MISVRHKIRRFKPYVWEKYYKALRGTKSTGSTYVRCDFDNLYIKQVRKLLKTDHCWVKKVSEDKL